MKEKTVKYLRASAVFLAMSLTTVPMLAFMGTHPLYAAVAIIAWLFLGVTALSWAMTPRDRS